MHKTRWTILFIFDYDYGRVALKETVRVVNHFTGEGIYTCHVSNIRGGGVRIKRKSEPAIVLVPILPTNCVCRYDYLEAVNCIGNQGGAISAVYCGRLPFLRTAQADLPKEVADLFVTVRYI